MDYLNRETNEPKITTVYSLLVEQMNKEFQNSRMYLNFAGICDVQALTGIAKYFKEQSIDELKHFQIIYEYISMRGWNPTLTALPDIEFIVNWSPIELFAQAHQLEVENLVSIARIQGTSLDEKDYQTCVFLNDLITTQTKEIDEMLKWKQRFVLASESPAAILMLDEKIGEL